MASSSERLWTTLAVAAGTLVIAGLVLSAPAVQRCQGSPEGIWSCLRQQVIDYGLLPEEPAEETAAAQIAADSSPSGAPSKIEGEPATPATAADEPIIVADQPAAEQPDIAEPGVEQPASDALPATADPVQVHATESSQPPAPPVDPGTESPQEVEPTAPASELDPLATPSVDEGNLVPDDITSTAAAEGEDGTSSPTPPEATPVNPSLPVPPASAPAEAAATLPPTSALPTPELEADLALSATAQLGASAAAAVATEADLSGPELAPSAKLQTGIDVALLSGVTVVPPEPQPPTPSQSAPLVPAEPADLAPTPGAGNGGDGLAPAPNTPLQPASPAAPLTPSPLAAPTSPPPAAEEAIAPPETAAPAEPPLVPQDHGQGEDGQVPVAAEPPAALPAEPATAPLHPAADAAITGPAPAPYDASQQAQQVADRLEDARIAVARAAEQGAASAPEPVPVPPPPTLVASAALVAPPIARATAAPAIDAVEIDGEINLFAGTGPEGARVDLFVGNRYIDSATVEGGRWLVETRSALQFPSERLRVSLASDAAGSLSVGSDAILDFNVAPAGVRLVGKEAAAAVLAEPAQAESELELGGAITRLAPLESANPDLLRFRAGKAIIRRGDTLWAIARRVYGRGILYRRIYEANRDQIRRPGRIYPGQVFDLPSAE